MELGALVRNKRLLLVAISIVTVTIVSLFFWMIYSKDKPGFVPEETRGAIREGIKENIVAPIEKVTPKAGELIKNKAYKEPTSFSDSNTADWPVYKNEEFGLGIRYPKNWKLKLQSNENLSLTTRLFLTADPSSERKDDAQITIELDVAENYMIEDRLLGNISIQRSEPKMVDTVNGTLYRGEIFRFEDGARVGSAIIWIGEKNGTVYSVCYNTNVEHPKDLENDYQSILEGLDTSL